VGYERETHGDRAEPTAAPARAAGTAGPGLAPLQRALGNAGMARLLATPHGTRALRGLARWPWDKKPELLPDEPLEIPREPDLPPFTFIPKMEAHAEREREGKHPPTPQKFEPGDHVWYYPHPDPDVPRITADYDVPRDLWFPGSTGKTDYKGHGMEIREFVIYENEVKEGWPHMKGKPGTTAWINNNPGNLSGDKADVGQYKGKANWHGFLIFPTRQAGYDAIPKWLKAYGYYSKGIFNAMDGYAPASDGNDPVKYANDIVTALRGETTPAGAPITLDTPLGELSEAQMRKFQDAIVEQEGTITGIPHARSDENLPWEIRKRL
jgi:hypothetical protein